MILPCHCSWRRGVVLIIPTTVSITCPMPVHIQLLEPHLCMPRFPGCLHGGKGFPLLCSLDLLCGCELDSCSHHPPSLPFLVVWISTACACACILVVVGCCWFFLPVRYLLLGHTHKFLPAWDTGRFIYSDAWFNLLPLPFGTLCFTRLPLYSFWTPYATYLPHTVACHLQVSSVL